MEIALQYNFPEIVLLGAGLGLGSLVKARPPWPCSPQDFLSQQGGAWSPQKVTGLSAKEGAQQYLEAEGNPPATATCWVHG